MTKIWSEPYDSLRHRSPMPPTPEREAIADRHFRSKTLEPYRVILVRVCAFTFEFHTVDEIRACLAFYARKIHPSGRSAAAAEADVAWRHEVQHWHERLPLYLREEPKRVQVVAALEEALRLALAEKI